MFTFKSTLERETGSEEIDSEEAVPAAAALFENLLEKRAGERMGASAGAFLATYTGGGGTALARDTLLLSIFLFLESERFVGFCSSSDDLGVYAPFAFPGSEDDDFKPSLLSVGYS